MSITAVSGTNNNNTFALSQTTTAAGSRPKSGNTTGAADSDSTSGGTAVAAQGGSTSGKTTAVNSGSTSTSGKTTGANSGSSGNTAVGAGMVAQYFDKKDLNKDGTVTEAEEMEYDLKHPGATSPDNTNYTQQGNIGSKTAEPGSALDIYA